MPASTSKPTHSQNAVAIKAYPLKFTGSGAQYFRVWIVNVLLTLLTLGIYTPWARRRTAMYFFSHSVVARSPLEFSASLKRMVIGFFIFLALYFIFDWALDSNNVLVVFLALFSAAVAIPFLWGSAKRFRITATRWRGLRLRFATNWKEIYWASWPVFIVATLWFITYVGIDMIQTFTTPSLLEDPDEQPLLRMGVVGWTLVVVSLIGTVLSMIRVDFNYRRLQVSRTFLGEERGVWKAGYFDFVKVWLATIGLFLALLAAIGGTAWFAATNVLGEDVASALFSSEQDWSEEDDADYADYALEADAGTGSYADSEIEEIEVYEPGFEWDSDESGDSGEFGEGLERAIFAFMMGVALMYLALFLAFSVAQAFREAKTHLLVWNSVGISDIARFRCSLKPARFVWLRIQNVVLTLLTLGLYRPFARVREYRAKWNATSIYIKGGVTQVKGLLLIQQEGGGFADAIADYAGFDIVG